MVEHAQNHCTPDYLSPYQQWANEHGTGFGVTLWASRQSQLRRFAVFTELAYLHDKRILDAGCGRADLAVYLQQRDIQYKQYIGLDALKETIAFAQSRKLHRATFRQGDALQNPEFLKSGNPQVICICGTLNTMTFSQAMFFLQHAWEAASETLLFNFLSDTCDAQAPVQKEYSRRLPTLKLLAWAMQQTWRVVLRQDYFPLGHDATILMHKV